MGKMLLNIVPKLAYTSCAVNISTIKIISVLSFAFAKEENYEIYLQKAFLFFFP